MKKPVVITIASLSVAAVAAAGIGAYSQRALFDEIISHQKSVTAADLADFTAQHDKDSSVSIAPRPWMAPDAKDFQLRFTTQTTPGWDIMYTSKTGLTPELLKAGKCDPVAQAPKPALAVDWLPATISDGDVFECQADLSYDIFVTQQGDTVYGWQGPES
jgi:hypothetical protein